MPQDTPRVFVSYSHADERWASRLAVHLRAFEVEGLAEAWDDRRLGAGENWRDSIRAAIESAEVSVLLVSPSFLSSSFTAQIELPLLLQQKSRGRGVIPILLSPCRWEDVGDLRSFQILPSSGRPLSELRPHEIDAELAGVARRLRDQLLPKETSGSKETVPIGTPLRQIDVDALKGGDQRELGTFIAYIIPLVRRSVARVTRSSSVVDDVESEFLFELPKIIDAFDPTRIRPDGPATADESTASLTRFVLHSANRIARREVARTQRHVPTEEVPDHDLGITSTEFGAEQLLVGSIKKALESLPANHRQLITYRYIDDLTFDEIARRLSISTASARVGVYRAVRRIRDLLDQQERSGS